MLKQWEELHRKLATTPTAGRRKVGGLLARAQELAPLMGAESSMGWNHGRRDCLGAEIMEEMKLLSHWGDEVTARGVITVEKGEGVSLLLSPTKLPPLNPTCPGNLTSSHPGRELGHHSLQGSALYCAEKSRRIGNNLRANSQMTHPWWLLLLGSSLKFFFYSELMSIAFHVIFYRPYNFNFHIEVNNGVAFRICNEVK